MSQPVQDALGNMLVAAMPLVVLLIAYVCRSGTAWLKIHEAALQTRVGAANWSIGQEFVMAAVKTAEQLATQNGWDGPAKKAYVLRVGQHFFDQHHVPLNATDLDVLIEATVRDGWHKATEQAQG